MVGRGQMLHPFDDGRRGFIRGGPGPLGPPLRHPLDMLPPLAAMERKLVVEEAEIQRLLVENQKLAENHVLLRQQLALEQQEASRLQEGLVKIHAEKADQMRLWTERAAKMEADVRALNPLKAELQRTQADVQKLLAQRQEYGSQAQQLQDEIVRIRSDLQRLPARKAEIEAMQQELIRARSAYEAEKNAYADLVEQRQSIDKNMIDMAREIERLRAELIEVDKKMQGDSGYPAIGSNPYRASYDLGQAWPGGDSVSTYGAGAGTWGGAYDLPRTSGSHLRR